MSEYSYVNAEEYAKYGAEAWAELWSARNTEIGHFLRNAPIVVVLGSTVFCHAGLRSSTLRAFGGDIEGVNAFARRWLTEQPIADADEQHKRMLLMQSDGPLWTRAFEPRLYLT